MSDVPDFKAIYPRSHHSMMGYSAEPEPEPPEKVTMDKAVYDDLIAAGRTPEYAKEQAEHVSFTRRVYANSQIRPSPDLPVEAPVEPAAVLKEPEPGPDLSKIYPASSY